MKDSQNAIIYQGVPFQKIVEKSQKTFVYVEYALICDTGDISQVLPSMSGNMGPRLLALCILSLFLAIHLK